MDEHIDITLSADDDGFISQECPACIRRFKIVPGEGSDKPISFCPYCRHQGHDCWWTPEQAEYLSGIVGEQVIGPELDKLAREFDRDSSGGGFVQIAMNVASPPAPVRPGEPNEDLPIVRFPCCNERIKHDGKESQLSCIICGILRITESS